MDKEIGKMYLLLTLFVACRAGSKKAENAWGKFEAYVLTLGVIKSKLNSISYAVGSVGFFELALENNPNYTRKEFLRSMKFQLAFDLKKDVERLLQAMEA